MAIREIKRRTRKIILKKSALAVDNAGFSDEDIATLILRIKTSLWPILRQRKAPKHCGKCRLIRFCKIIKQDLICPWPNMNREKFMKEEQKELSLKIYIVTAGESGSEDKKEVLVELKSEKLIERFKRVLDKQGKKRAIKFAMSKGEILDEPRDSAQLILTEDSVSWDLMA